MNKQKLLSVPRILSLVQLLEQPDTKRPREESRQAYNPILKQTFGFLQRLQASIPTP